MPVQGHDAARRVQQQQLRARPRGDADQRGPAALPGQPARASSYDLADDDGRHPRHGVQGGVRRHPLEPVATSSSASCGSRPSAVLCTDPYVTVDPTSCRSTRCSPRPTCCHRDAAPASTATSTTDKPVVDIWNLLGQRRARMSAAAVSVVIPAYNEGDGDRRRASTGIFEAVTLPCEVLVVVDIARRHHGARTSRSTPTRRPAARADAQHLRPRARRNAIRFGIDHAPARRSSWSRWPTAATTRARSTSSPGWSSAASWSPPRRATCPAASRSAARCFKRLLSRHGRPLAALVRPGRHPRRHQLVQGLLDRDFVREVGIDSRRRLRDRHRADRQGAPAAAAGRRDPHDLAGPQRTGTSNFKLRAVDPEYLRWYRFAFGPPARPLDAASAASRHAERPREQRPMSEGPRHRLGRLHRRLRRRGAARPRPRGRRHRQLLQVRPGREVLRRPPELPTSSRATPATSS